MLERAGRFSYDKGGVDSLHYVIAKSSDILFQDVLALVVFFELAALVGTNAIPVFALYFLIVHLALFFVLPVRYGVVFVLASLAAGFAFAYLASYGLALAVFVVHWSFYIAAYPTIQRLRQRHYNR